MNQTINARLWNGAVLRAIAKVPAGEKLRIGDIGRSLQLDQAGVIRCIETLIAEGRMDAKTLRPPVAVTTVTPARALLPTGQQLSRQLRDEGERRGLSARAVSIAAFGTTNQLNMMSKGGTRPVTARVYEKAQAWLASPWQPEAIVTGAALADEIAAFLQRTGMSAGRFGTLAMNGTPGGPKRLRSQRRVGDEMVRRVRDFIANPPAEALQPMTRGRRPKPITPSRPLSAKPTAGDSTPPAVVPSSRSAPQPCQPDAAPAPPPAAAATLPRAAAARRDPTQRPATPLMDLADKRRLGAQRHAAAINRGREQHAASLVDAGVDPNSQNTIVGAQMRAIVGRREAEARQADPVEQAKLALRQRGRVVFCASVYNGPKGRFFVSGITDDDGRRKLLTGDDLVTLANRVNPRGMRPPVLITTRNLQEGAAK